MRYMIRVELEPDHVRNCMRVALEVRERGQRAVEDQDYRRDHYVEMDRLFELDAVADTLRFCVDDLMQFLRKEKEAATDPFESLEKMMAEWRKEQ